MSVAVNLQVKEKLTHNQLIMMLKKKNMTLNLVRLTARAGNT